MKNPEAMSDVMEVVTNVPAISVIIPNADTKVPRARTRVVSMDRTPTSSPRRYFVRQSTDSPKPSIDITNHKRTENHAPQMSPTVKLHRLSLEAQSPKEKALSIGLDPQGLELISSMMTVATSTTGSEYSDKSDDIIGMSKMTREMKNLQKSTTDSKILSDYLSTSSESPRSRSRKTKETPIVDPDEEVEDEEEELKEASLEEELSIASVTNDGNETDSTIVLPMEPPEKRRKSVSRSRSRARSDMRGRKKSIARQMKAELSLTSDRDDDDKEDADDQMSETSFVTSQSIEGRPVNPPPKLGWDSFCFKCHTDNAVLSLACSTCKCSYHRHCVRPNPIPKNADLFVCPECLEIQLAEESSFNKYGHEKIDANTLADMLTIILEKIRTYPDREHFENEIVVKAVKEQPLIVTQMSLKILETRLKNRFYKVTEAFIHDIKLLEHNWNVADRSKAKSLKSIVKYVNTEINELEACVYCYEKSFISAEWFVNPCKRPHLLIWAKLKGYPFWPAKVMSVDPRQHVDVRFFGAHDRAWVPALHCMLFSEKDPNKTKGSTPTNTKNSKTQKGITDAMKEKDDYIANLREKFGFKYFPFRQPFNANDLQGQLETMLPGLKSLKEGGEKEADGNQKEKLTLKIVKGQSSNYQVEHKTGEQRTPTIQKSSEKDKTKSAEKDKTKPVEKEKPKLYKVLSRNDENSSTIIIKRKSNVEQESEKSKKSKVSDTASETSESNASGQSGKMRHKGNHDLLKHKKSIKNVEKDALLEPPGKKARHSDKHKVSEEGDDEVAKVKATRRSRMKSTLPEADKPLLVPLIIPPGTDEIGTLRQASLSPILANRVKNRVHSYHRSRSTESKNQESKKEEKLPRRVSISSPIKRPSTDVRKPSVHEPEPEPTVEVPPVEIAAISLETDAFDPDLVMHIKDEPVSDHEDREEIAASCGFVVGGFEDIPNLLHDKSGKRKLIMIDTNDDGSQLSAAAKQQGGRARKTFPNSQNQRQLDAMESQQLQQVRNGDWMVCIPQALVPPQATSSHASTAQSSPSSNRSTPVPEPQVSVSQARTNSVSSRSTPNSQTTNMQSPAAPTSNRSQNSNVVPPLSFVNIMNSQALRRRNSVQANMISLNGQRVTLANIQQQNQVRTSNPVEPPRLAPRPQGVFNADGSVFNRDMGPVSRMFTDNAHRVSDYFRNIIMETVASFAPEVPTAENLMLRAEIEKLQREMQTTKSDCQHRMQELRREHQDELEGLKRSYEEKMKNLHLHNEQEKARLISEIRQQSEIEKQRAIELTRKETKKTTWCSNCTKEARFYCCWNTSYCGPPCQKSHWAIHQKLCTNKNSTNETSTQLVNKQTNTDAPTAPVQSLQTQVVQQYRPATLVLRPTQQLQQQPQMLPTQISPPVQLVVPQGNGNNLMNNIVSIASQPLIGSYQNTKQHAIRAIYHEHAIRQSEGPTNLVVKTIQRHDSPNVNVISKESIIDPIIFRRSDSGGPPNSAASQE